MKAVGIGIEAGLKMGVDQTPCLSGRSLEVCINLIRDIKAGEINSVILVVGGRLYDSKGRSWSDADKMEDYLKESGITCPIFSPIMDARNLREGAMDALHTRFFFYRRQMRKENHLKVYCCCHPVCFGRIASIFIKALSDYSVRFPHRADYSMIRLSFVLCGNIQRRRLSFWIFPLREICSWIYFKFRRWV